MTTFDAAFFNLVIMNIRHSLLGLFLPLSLFSCHTVEKEAVGRPLSSYVNPFVGASTNTELAGASHGLGKTFPGATAPFGMVQVSPNTITGGDNGPGYSYEHTTIEGFAFTQMSGIGWYGDLGNFLVMPTIGDLHTFAGTEDKPEEGYRSRYDKSTEKARQAITLFFFPIIRFRRKRPLCLIAECFVSLSRKARRPAYKSIWPGG